MRYTILDQKIQGKDLPRKVRYQIIRSKFKKVSWVVQVATISAIVDLTLRAIL
jgi:hypothetical protein